MKPDLRGRETPMGSAPLLVASNRGPLTVAAVEHGDDEIRRG
jgi:hypothetical protein